MKDYSKFSVFFSPDKVIRSDEELSLPTDELIREIFAPDPITGNPSSDLRLVVHGENQELNEYIRTHLMRPVGSHALLGSSDEDGEAALDALPRLDDGDDDYFNRLAQLASVNNQEVSQ